MNRYVVIGLAPTVLVAIGLHVAHSVTLTFALFFSWLAVVPLIDHLVVQKQSLSQAVGIWGLTVTARQALIGFGLGISFTLALLIGAYFLHDMLFDVKHLRSLLEKWHFSGNQSGLLLVVLVLLNPILEEIYWRGYLQSRNGQAPGSIRSLLLTSLWFTAYHLVVIIPIFNWPFCVVAALSIYTAGVLWGWIRDRSHSLFAPVLSHMLADLGIVIIYILYVQ
ncbi:CPBP family intramembrane glutamic endopeptidase [Brevibacillus sp. SYSU BS000544]|uniref:CPBP family intramembrane glutamic endopeptidase n=1 Tax=Brevibacillus sp. SYSU BS000544 TaxID=3416443 RepID=UPI003CE4B81C